MKKRNVIRILVYVAVAASAALFLRTLLMATVYAPEAEVYVPQVATQNIPERPLPVRLEVPALHISAKVEHVGVNGKGNMMAPASYDDVAWYKGGTIPGQRGSAVMAGHLNDGLGLSGVFEKLKTIKPNDEIFSVDEKGNRIRFVVEKIETYDYKSVPLDELFGKKDAVRLNLISCTGHWTWDGRTYDERIVVYTKYEG